MKRLFSIIPLVAMIVWSAACQTQKVPAETALKAAEDAWAPISAEATRYVPDQAKGIDSALTAAREAMAKGDYEGVIKGATDLPARIADVQKALTEKKSEWLAARKLPAGVDKAAVESAKTALATAQQAFEDGKTAYRDGDYTGALAKANQSKAELVRVVTDLKLDMPLLQEAGGALTESAKETIKGALEKK